jgi:hypothetical protein
MCDKFSIRIDSEVGVMENVDCEMRSLEPERSLRALVNLVMRRMSSSGVLRSVTLVRTDVSEEHIASIIR